MAAKRRKKRKKVSLVGIFFKTLLLMMLIICLGLAGVFYFGGYYDEVKLMKEEADAAVASVEYSDFVPSQTGEIYDAGDNLISETRTDKDSTYLKFENIPELFVRTMVSIEDKKFYQHGGVDYKAIARAFKELLINRRITQGGSTITMQLSRGIFLTNEVSWRRKVREIFIALDLEKKYSKNEIMEFYLNNIYFANGYYGIEAASEGYFNKSAAALDVSQVAFLCAIPNSPTYYDPIVNIEHTLTRRDLILANMLEDGAITQSEYDEAVSEKIALDLSGNNGYRVLENNYVVSYTYHCATEAIMEMKGFVFRYDFASDDDKEAYQEGYDEFYTECESALYTGGYKIYTTFDMEKQDLLQECIDETLAGFTEIDDSGKYKMQGAAVCIDNSTGRVIAMVGGRSSLKEAGLTLNRAFQSRRQPGSSIKPLLVYTPAFEHGYYTKTEVTDEEIEDGPSNAGGGYLGDMELSEAVQRSLNTVAWQVYEDVTPQVGLKYLKNMEFHHICDSDNVLATALGGFTHGVEPVEMASGYATLQYDGYFRRPTCIRYIEDFFFFFVYVPSASAKRIYELNADRMMVSVLEGVLEESWGTGRGLKLSGGMPAAGKTGTTDSAKDGWFCGFTHYYTTSVWVGCDTPESVKNLQGATFPGAIWHSFMDTIHEGLAPVGFADYDHTEEDKLFDDDDDDDYDEEEERRRLEEEQKKLEEEQKKIEEEKKRQEEELKRQEEEAKKQEEEKSRKEEEDRKQQEEAEKRQKEEEERQKEEEKRRQEEEEKRKQEEEAKKKQEEEARKQQEEEAKKRQEEEEKKRQEEEEKKKQEEEEKKKQEEEEKKKQEEEEEKKRQEEEEKKKQEEEERQRQEEEERQRQEEEERQRQEEEERQRQEEEERQQEEARRQQEEQQNSSEGGNNGGDGGAEDSGGGDPADGGDDGSNLQASQDSQG